MISFRLTNAVILLARIIALLSSLSIGRIVPSTEAFVFSFERRIRSRWGTTTNSYYSSYRTHTRSGSAHNGNRAPVHVCLRRDGGGGDGGVEQGQGGVQVQVRDWKEGDGTSIMDLLTQSQSQSQSGFNPEGPLNIDCSSEDLIQESYSENGACMLVATIPVQDGSESGSVSYNGNGGSGGNGDDNSNSNSERIVGTAALTVGTPVTYLKSGASVSSSPTDITGAIRRVCAVDESILQPLLRNIEIRALEAGVGQLILLAYPNPESIDSSGGGGGGGGRTITTTTTTCRPGTALLKSMGYEELPINLKGVDAVQYGKNLVDQNQNRNDANTNADENSNADENANAVNNSLLKLNNHSSNEQILDAAVGASFLALLLAFVLGVGNFMGLELLPTIGSSRDNNRGIGSPLSVQELELLRQDERLQRTDLDGGASASAVDGGIRQWKDLSFEERQEEATMMKIIQGQSTRLK